MASLRYFPSTGTDKSGVHCSQAIFCPRHVTSHVNTGLRLRVKFRVRVKVLVSINIYTVELTGMLLVVN